MQVIIIKNCHLLMTEPPTHLPTNRQALLRVCPLSRLTQGGARGGGGGDFIYTKETLVWRQRIITWSNNNNEITADLPAR